VSSRLALERDPAALDRRFDILVIGAGITGVQIAREAATRGRSVLVVDRGDFGSGTSAATTKYIHGGIRYLEHYDLEVVRESLRERRIVALSAPHLVCQTRFLLPVWSWSKPGRLLLGTGAAVYDALAFDRNRGAPAQLRIGHPRWLGRKAALRSVPWLDPVELRGAVVVTDTLNVHPERLLLEYLLDAVSLGVVARNHLAVTGFITTGGTDGTVAVDGVELTDQLNGSTHRVRADAVVNAGGPWMGEVLGRLATGLGRHVGPRVSPSKGVHLLTTPVQGSLADGVTDAVMARARNGRHVVVSPWQGREFIGPTDTPVEVAPDEVAADASDVDSLLEIVNSCRTSSAQLTSDEVDDVTVGIRPLVSEPGADTYTASRRHEIYDHAADGAPGLWSVAGGKWTTGRAIAEDVVDRLSGSSRRMRSTSSTRQRPVPGASGWAHEPQLVIDRIVRYRPEVQLSVRSRRHVARLFGMRGTEVVDRVAEDERLGQSISSRPEVGDIGAQVVVAVIDEGARTLADIADRRLVIGTLGRLTLEELQRVAAIAAPLLGWSDDGRVEALSDYQRRERSRALWER
jgi:glycerol-3-phosphate dehydrogenase